MHALRSLPKTAAPVPGLALRLALALILAAPLARPQSVQTGAPSDRSSSLGVETTTVTGTVYAAGGAPVSGTLQISWPAFTTAAGQAIAAGHVNVNISANGQVSVPLAPNIGAAPAGLYYTAVYHLADGTTSTEYWVVPNSIQATIGQIRSRVMPAAQAVQAVSKSYVDQSIQQAVSSQVTPAGGTLTGPLFLSGDPTQPSQASNKHYVDLAVAGALPIGGGTLFGPVTATRIGAVFQADQFPGSDFGAQLQACINALDTNYGGTCDARNFQGQLSMASNLTVSTANVTIYLPCSTIATAVSILVPAGTRNVTFHGCASRGTSAASGDQGGTVFAYSGSTSLLQIGDPSFLADTKGFRLDNAALNTTAAQSANAQAIALYRTQEVSLASLYLLGNGNQIALTLDGTGNYTGGTFEDLQITGYLTAVNAIGHTISNPATTDWLNASTFVRLHVDCPTQNGIPVSGTTGINLSAGDGNTITGGDVESCSTALHLGPHAQNNTILGLRNENSTTQIQADPGSSYNNWITGGTMFTGKLVDQGTRNSFLDTFHRSFNALNGDWYGSQQDSTVTNHFRLGTGTGIERGLLDRYQTDYGYRWTTGLSDASAGQQYYQVLDELNNVYRLSIGQYNNGQPNSNNQTALNAAGSGAVILNGSNNAGTGGVVFGSGGPASSTVATVDKSGNAHFTGSLLADSTAQSAGTMTVRNNADSEVDYYLWPGVTASQKGSFTYKDFNGASQWYLVKDQNNNWALNSAIGGLDSFKAYQSTNSGDTYINASNASGAVRVNYESGAGSSFNIYGGNSSSLYASFTGPASIKFPGLAAASGYGCLQVDNSGYLSHAAQPCGAAASVVSAGLAFPDASVQTTSQQGALTGLANDSTARSVATSAQAIATAALPANGISTTSANGGSLSAPGTVAGATALFSKSMTTPAVTSSMVNNVYTVDGVTYTTGAAAISACLTHTAIVLTGAAPVSAAGCVVDMRGSGWLGSAADVLGAVDPVVYCTNPGVSGNVCTVPTPGTCVTSLPARCIAIPMVIELGPFSDYLTDFLVLETSFQMLGTATNSPTTGSLFQYGTAITSSSTSNVPFIQIPQDAGRPATHVLLRGIHFIAAAGNTSQSGLYAECGSTGVGSGIWRSLFEDLSFDGFMGNGIRLDSSPNGASVCANQFLQFVNVHSFRPSGAGFALSLGGGTGNNQFWGGQYDTKPSGDVTGSHGCISGVTCATNIYIGATSAWITASISGTMLTVTDIDAANSMPIQIGMGLFGTGVSGNGEFITGFGTGTGGLGTYTITNPLSVSSEAMTITGNQNVYSELFQGIISQKGAQLINFNGAFNITLHAPHHEASVNGYVFTLSGSQNRDINVDKAYFAGNIAVTPGSYLFDTTNSSSGLALSVTNSSWSSATTMVLQTNCNVAQVLNFHNNLGSGVTSCMLQNLASANTINTKGMHEVRITGTVPITNITSTLVVGEKLRIVGGNPASQLVAVSQAPVTAYACALDGSSNNYCTFTANNAFYTGGGWTILGSSLTGSCAALNGIAGITVSPAVGGGPAAPASTQFSVYTTLLTGSGSCTGTFSLVSNLNLVGRPSLTLSSTNNESALFEPNDQTGLFDLVSDPKAVNRNFYGTTNVAGISINGGSALTDNQGTGAKVQHATGPFTPGDYLAYNVDGSAVDSGSSSIGVNHGVFTWNYPNTALATGNSQKIGWLQVPVGGGVASSGMIQATSFSCTVTPVTVKVYDCGTSFSSCTSPVEIATVDISSNVVTASTISSSTMTAGHWLAAQATAGTCSSFLAALRITY
jgi:hypothetical protein